MVSLGAGGSPDLNHMLPAPPYSCEVNLAYPDPMALSARLGGLNLSPEATVRITHNILVCVCMCGWCWEVCGGPHLLSWVRSQVGGRADLAPTRHFRGALAGLGVWGADVTTSQVACAYRGGVALGPPPPLPDVSAAHSSPFESLMPLPATRHVLTRLLRVSMPLTQHANPNQDWFGCSDAAATNFDPAVLSDSTTCVYPPPCWGQTRSCRPGRGPSCCASKLCSA